MDQTQTELKTELTIVRMFDAPPALVFRMWTDPAHTSRVFQTTSALLGVTDIELNEVHRARGIKDQDLPPGVIVEETEDLAARTLRIARLGRLRRQNADLNQAWYGNEALDGDPDACLSQACRR